MQQNWVVKIGWQMPRMEIAGDIYVRRPRPTQGCRADNDDDDDDDDDDYVTKKSSKIVFIENMQSVLQML